GLWDGISDMANDSDPSIYRNAGADLGEGTVNGVEGGRKAKTRWQFQRHDMRCRSHGVGGGGPAVSPALLQGVRPPGVMEHVVTAHQIQVTRLGVLEEPPECAGQFEPGIAHADPARDRPVPRAVGSGNERALGLYDDQVVTGYGNRGDRKFCAKVSRLGCDINDNIDGGQLSR